jgi:ATP-dependent Clp protease protease subunit
VTGPYPNRPPEPWRTPTEPPGAGLSPWLEERLFGRRIVMLQGTLTASAASRAAAALLMLDAMGSLEPVELHMAVPEGELGAAFAVVDAVDAMRAPVHAIVTAQVGGAAVAVLTAADRRIAYRHARIRLVEPRAAGMAGTADEVAAAAGQYLRELEELAVRLAEVTGQPRSRVEDDLSTGKILTAEQAREYGLIDAILGDPA